MHDDPQDDSGEDSPPDGEDAYEEAPSEGYAWGFTRQERELPGKDFRAHIHLLDEIEEDELEGLDLSRADDYILWAAAQAFEEIDRDQDAIALLKRIAGSTARHPALDYPDILLHLAEHLKDRGDYDEANAVLDKAEGIEPDLHGPCDERRAEILVLRGRTGEGLALFREAARAAPGDPWVPLRAAWALLASGRYAEIPPWIEESEHALEDVKDEEEARSAAGEIDRLRQEAEGRRARRERLEASGMGPVPGLERLKDDILTDLDAEESRLTGNPPLTEDTRARASERLAVLHARASKGWDDAVEARDETLIAEFDELQGDVVGLAGRFGIPLPGVD
jgi:tetratricopeptide (TPR) repeat protein